MEILTRAMAILTRAMRVVTPAMAMFAGVMAILTLAMKILTPAIAIYALAASSSARRFASDAIPFFVECAQACVCLLVVVVDGAQASGVACDFGQG